MPSVPIYIREANYQRLRKTAEKTGKTIGQIINELLENSLQNTIEASYITAHQRSAGK
jgi:predicted DNA-binding protein